MFCLTFLHIKGIDLCPVLLFSSTNHHLITRGYEAYLTMDFWEVLCINQTHDVFLVQTLFVSSDIILPKLLFE